MVRTEGKAENDVLAIEQVSWRLISTELILLLCHADFSDFAGKSRLNEAVKTFLAHPQMEHFFELLVRKMRRFSFGDTGCRGHLRQFLFSTTRMFSPQVELLSVLHDNRSDAVFREILGSDVLNCQSFRELGCHR